jgi:hypothetical protein
MPFRRYRQAPSRWDATPTPGAVDILGGSSKSAPGAALLLRAKPGRSKKHTPVVTFRLQDGLGSAGAVAIRADRTEYTRPGADGTRSWPPARCARTRHEATPDPRPRHADDLARADATSADPGGAGRCRPRLTPGPRAGRTRRARARIPSSKSPDSIARCRGTHHTRRWSRLRSTCRYRAHPRWGHRNQYTRDSKPRRSDTPSSRRRRPPAARFRGHTPCGAG